MVWRDWKKPGKVTLFDSDASFNYVLAFITKSKKQKAKKKKKKEGEREERQQHPAAGWEMTFQFVN